MPTPRKDEKESDYISRCVEQVMEEGLDKDQALGKCYGMWKEHKNKKPLMVRIYRANSKR